MRNIWILLKRELKSYFITPIAYVFLIIFVVLSGVFTFYLGSFFQRGSADLVSFFNFHPWLYLFLIPAISMRLWSEERRGGTIELLLTLPVTLPEVVVAKFLAAWVFTALALVLTCPLWVTVNYLGSPDNGVILTSYLGSWLMAGSYLAIGCCLSAVSKNQVIAFVLTVIVCLGFVLSGLPMVTDFFALFAPAFIVESIRSFSFLSHFNALGKGVVDLRDILFFASVIVFWLYSNTLIVEMNKAD